MHPSRRLRSRPAATDGSLADGTANGRQHSENKQLGSSGDAENRGKNERGERSQSRTQDIWQIPSHKLTYGNRCIKLRKT